MRLFLSLFFCLTLTQTAIAADLVRLYVWNPGTTLAPLILPVKNDEPPEKAAQRYLSELSRNPELMELFQGRSPYLPLQNFKALSDEKRESSALLIANNPRDFTKDSPRITNFKKIFSQGGQTSYILPLNANLGLSKSETQDLHKQISEKFPFLVAMGGDDVDPRFYKQENFHARNTIPVRDAFEISLIKSYVTKAKGFLLGICRGSQITSVALGYQLIQDVPFHIGDKVAHANDWHDIKLQETTHKILKSSADKNSTMHVNSLHHQSVIFKEGGILEIAARGQDGVTEATEFKNGRGLLLQFHPELMNNFLGSQILQNVIQQKNRVMPLRCSQIF